MCGMRALLDAAGTFLFFGYTRVLGTVGGGFLLLCRAGGRSEYNGNVVVGAPPFDVSCIVCFDPIFSSLSCSK
jgi:hypothetical protein